MQDFLMNSLDNSIDVYLQKIAHSNVHILNSIKESVGLIQFSHSEILKALPSIEKNISQSLSEMQKDINDKFSKRIKLVENKIDILISEDRENGNRKLLALLEDISNIKNQQESETETLPHDVRLVKHCKNSYEAGGVLDPRKSNYRLCSAKILQNAHYYKNASGDPICYKCGQNIASQQ